MWGKRSKIREKRAVNNFMKWYITTQAPHGEATVREAIDHVKTRKSTLIYTVNKKQIGRCLYESNNFIKTLKYSKKYRQELNHWRLK